MKVDGLTAEQRMPLVERSLAPPWLAWTWLWSTLANRRWQVPCHEIDYLGRAASLRAMNP